MTLPYRSPIAAQPVRSSNITLTDLSGQGLIDIRGRDLGGIFQLIRIGGVKQVENGILTRLTPEQLMLLVDGKTDSAVAWLKTESGGGARVTITDVTHGYGQMRLSGEYAKDVLPKICGLNFADAEFSNYHAAQSSLAKVRTLIVRLDEGNLPAYRLIVGLSLTAYVWDVVTDAIQELS